MNSKVGHPIQLTGGGEQTPSQVLNDQVSQDLLAVRLLLTQAQEEEADRVEIIKRCNRYLNFALGDLKKLRDSARDGHR
jgi:hypothetical protein